MGRQVQALRGVYPTFSGPYSVSAQTRWVTSFPLHIMNVDVQTAKLSVALASDSLGRPITSMVVVSPPLKACHIKTETFTYEEKEQQLVNDCVKELRE